MHRLKNIKWLPLLMVVSILAIAAFQYYWLQKAYDREERGLERQTNMLFRETVISMQASKLKLDRIADSSKSPRVYFRNEGLKGARRVMDPKMVNMMNAMLEKVGDTTKRTVLIRDNQDTLKIATNMSGQRERVMQFLFDIDAAQDSIRVSELDSAYARRLNEQNLDIPYTIHRLISNRKKDQVFNEVTLGFQNPVTYRLTLGKVTGFLLGRIAAPIIFSFFLIGFTLLSFTLLYRNLLKQRRLADIKNEFISNITHELKTPIATVSVAIEALRSFNASMDSQKTKEYLDISANELQRLSLLVDKVLKLSMFEKKEVELRYEQLDMRNLVDEVTSSMRLQFEKHHADISVHSDSDTTFEGDRLHVVSVIFNLLDNALKYSSEKPKIRIDIHTENDQLLLSIADSGIGIPQVYHSRIFEKFFRVPTGNLHNAKGYGLGLSYVAHVVQRHKGSIKVESAEGSGSRFAIRLPRRQSTRQFQSNLKDVA